MPPFEQGFYGERLMRIVETRFTILCACVLAVVTLASVKAIAQSSQRLPDQSTLATPSASMNSIVLEPTSENTPVRVATSPIIQPWKPSKSVVSVQATAPGVSVGTTWYDFQTNGSMAERVTLFEDGAERYLQVVWMASQDSGRTGRVPGFSNSRGSYYNFVDVSDPTAPSVTIDEWKKIESSSNRAGWPSLVQFPDGNVGTPSHNTVFNGTVVKFFANGGPGDNGFGEYSQPTAVADTALWPRAAVDGQGNVHLIYNRTLPDGSSQLAYRRSTDFGENWDTEILFTGASGLLPQGASGTLPNGAGGDTYAITARGPNVVVAYSDGPLRILTRKSTDYGATWDDPQVGVRLLLDAKHTFLDSAVYGDGFTDSIRLWSDTVVAPSSQIAIAIDSDGMAHYVIGQTLTYIIQTGLKDNSQAGSRSGTIYSVNEDSFYQNTGMYYYKEGDTLIYNIAPAGGGEWDGQGEIISRRAYTGSSRFPQLGMDAANNLYLVYTSVKSGDAMPMQIDTSRNGARDNEPDTLINVDGLFGHLYVSHKPANSYVWSAPKDITPDGVNCIFGTLCDNVTDNMYIAYSASAIPGDRVTSVETPSAQATIYVYPFPIAELSVPASVSEQHELSANITVSPNPATNEARIHIESVTPGAFTVSVVTMQGQQLMKVKSPEGSNAWDLVLPTQLLASGTYQIVIEQLGAYSTRTLSIVR